MPRYSRPSNSSLYVRNVPDATRPEELKAMFSKYGPVTDVYIPQDYYTRRPRGFAYVQFEDMRDAEDAMYGLDRSRFCGRELVVEFAQGDRKTPHDMRGKDRPRRRSPYQGRHDNYNDYPARRRHRSRSRSREHRVSSRNRRRRSHSRSKSHSPRRVRSYDRNRSRSRSPSRNNNHGSASPSPVPSGDNEKKDVDQPQVEKQEYDEKQEEAVEEVNDESANEEEDEGEEGDEKAQSQSESE